ncbi:hypothetical protein [Streptomyces sp. NPDC046862]|uniref:hypothetical protein n=1 Tax=Streptomyces sp. NPDC046862 TaxID=3154603 RepID=UPI0034517804
MTRAPPYGAELACPHSIPPFGRNSPPVRGFVTNQLATGRGRTTLYRYLATLSSALRNAVRQHHLVITASKTKRVFPG